MPKETIYTDTPNSDEDEFPPFAISVGWLKDCDVQVGITTTGDRHFVDAILSSGTVEDTIINMRHLGASAAIAIREYVGAPVELVSAFKTSEDEDRFMFDLGCAISEHLRSRYPEWKSVWWHPGRFQINKLIRLLRTARDSAFGRDE